MLAGKEILLDVNALFQQAVAAGASDIHIEPPDELRPHPLAKDVRSSIRQGDCLASALTASSSRIKVLAGLDIANRRLPPGRAHRSA